MRGSALAYSGSMGNAVRITKNNVYGNGSGLSTRHDLRLRAPGLSGRQRPDRPQPDLLEQPQPVHRRQPPVEPVVGVPVGVGILWPGPQQRARLRQLDLRQLAPRRRCCSRSRTSSSPRRARSTPGVSCPTAARRRPRHATTTFHDNHMGQAPARLHRARLEGLRASASRTATSPTSMPNGVDFWWDEGRATPATAGSTTPGPTAPRPASPARAPARRLRCCHPTAGPAEGRGDSAKTATLVDCSTW